MMLLFKIIENFHKGIFTTIIGLLIAFACLYSYFFDGLELERAITGVVIGAALCGLPDPKNPNSNTNIGVSIALFALFATLFGCSKPPVTSTVEKKDSTWITENVKDHRLFIKKDQASLSIDLDDLELISEDSATNSEVKIIDVAPTGQLLNDKKKNIPGRKWTSKSKQASVVAEISQDGKRLDITGDCDSLALLLQTSEKTIHHLKTEKSDSVKTVVEYKTHWYDIACRWIAGFYIAMLILTKIKL